MRLFFDTSVLVAASESSHPHHEKAWPFLQSAARRECHGIVSAHTLAELYAALTRLPLKPRISPADALRIIRENVLAHFEVVPLALADYEAVLDDMARRGLPGARIYDALLMRCAQISSAERIVTFSRRDFEELAPMDLKDRLYVP